VRNVFLATLAVVGLVVNGELLAAKAQCPGGICPAPSGYGQMQGYVQPFGSYGHPFANYGSYGQPFGGYPVTQPGPAWSVEVDVQTFAPPYLSGYGQQSYPHQPGVIVYRTPQFPQPHSYRQVFRQRWR